jgi:hypothetical protein
MSIKTDAELLAQIESVIVVNGNREITPPLHKAIEDNIVDSKLNIKDGGMVIQVLTGYTTELTPSNNKHLTPKKYVDDLVTAAVSDTAYDAGTWNGVTTIAPSKNAVRDKFEAMDALVVHLAGTETITGQKTFEAITRFEDSLKFLEDAAYQVGISTDPAGSFGSIINFGEEFGITVLTGTNFAKMTIGSSSVLINGVNGNIQLDSSAAVNITAGTSITMDGDDIIFLADDRVTFSAPTAITYIGTDLRFYTDDTETVGFKPRHTLLTGVREITWQDKNVTVAGINNETFTGTTNFSSVIFDSWARLKSYAVSGVPSAATAGAGAIIYVSDETGGAVPAFSDGTDWRRVTDRNVIA